MARWLAVYGAVWLMAAASLPSPVMAQTLRWGSRGDVLTVDPHTQNENVTTSMLALIFDALVDRDLKQALVPALAESWTVVNDLTWRFKLRAGVKFHDGTALTADDVVFSIVRAQQPNSQVSSFALPLGKPVAIDPLTAELRMHTPNPILLEHLSSIYIMSRAWSVAHKVEKVPNYNDNEEGFSSRHAMGTGPYILKRREPGVRMELSRNPAWWGRFEGNVQEIIFTPIESDATRVAALLSGDINFTPSAPTQDVERLSKNPAIRVTTGPENRIIFFGLDQHRDQLLNSSVKGKNPFKDVRVREAIFRAIDAQSLQKAIMRGQSVPTTCLTPAEIGCLAKELETHAPADPERAKQLMAEAGYAEGFDLTLDCPNDRYVNDQSICVALVGMLGRVGIRLKVDARPKSLFFPKVMKYDTSFYMYGWGGGTTDAQIIMDPVLHGWDQKTQRGGDNAGRVNDAELNRLIDAAASEMNVDKRSGLIQQVQRRVASQFLFLPLHRQMLTWISSANVHPVIVPSNQIRVGWFLVE